MTRLGRGRSPCLLPEPHLSHQGHWKVRRRSGSSYHAQLGCMPVRRSLPLLLVFIRSAQNAADRLRARLVSSSRSHDIAARMGLREILSPGDQWSRPGASRVARLARPHTSGVRGIEAETRKPGQETKISTKGHKTKAPTARPHRSRPNGGAGVSRLLLRSESCLTSTQSH